ncbi:MAG: GNAT family N-acetyltransferase [Actinomycetota bacterium]|nr:GNAT family N-acetyltransferase [Actinomycetota bacterium]
MGDAFLEGLTADHPRRVWATRIDGEGRKQVLVATVDEQVVGFVYFGPSDEDHHPPVGQVFSIHVAPTWVDRAVGKSLLDEAEDALRRERLREAMLWVIHSNVRARRFYERRGWQLDGARRSEPLALEGVSGPEVEVVRYRKPL